MPRRSAGLSNVNGKQLSTLKPLWAVTGDAPGMAFVSSPIIFYVIRFLLGVFEAGFFPGIILYLTYWFPAAERARATAYFMTAVALAGRAARQRVKQRTKVRRAARAAFMGSPSVDGFSSEVTPVIKP